jgi:nanoRNase/pAp phosphatase (c-di-AMP/oligoRNAs hydrolase)
MAALQSGKKPLGRARDSSGNPFLRLAAKKIGADSPVFLPAAKKRAQLLLLTLHASLPTPLLDCFFHLQDYTIWFKIRVAKNKKYMETEKDTKKYRLLTRSDFDGLAAAVLLKHLGIIDEIVFVHPKDMQDGRIVVSGRDIATNLPYVEGVALCFDHHESEVLRGSKRENHIIDAGARSAARVVWDYYGGEKVFPALFLPMIEAADKIDSADLTMSEVMDPSGWVLLGFITDSRTGLGRFKDFTMSNYDLMMRLIEVCRTKEIDDILELPDVKERIDLYHRHEDLARRQLARCSRIVDGVLIIDLRGEQTIYAGNRFTRYALYPQTNISIQVMWGRDKKNTVIAMGKSIFNKTSRVNIGALTLGFEGGGHIGAGTCQVDNEGADGALQEILKRIREAEGP